MLSILIVNFLVLVLSISHAYSVTITNIQSAFVHNIDRDHEESTLAENISKFGYAFVVGFGGVGKSHLVHNYVLKNLANYDVIWWVDCKGDINKQIEGLTNKLQPSKRVSQSLVDDTTGLEGLRDLAKTNDFNILIILDSLDNLQRIKDLLSLAKVGSFNIFVTSTTEFGYESTLRIGNFSRNQSINYLKKILRTAPEDELNALAETVKDYPLALGQSALFLHHHKSFSIEAYINLYKQDLKSLWKREERFLLEEKPETKSVQTALKLSLAPLKKELSKELLCLLLFTNNQSISLDFIMEIAKGLGWQQNDVLEATSELTNYFYLDVSHESQGKTSFFITENKQLFYLILFSQEQREILDKVAKAYVQSMLRKLKQNKDQLICFFKDNQEHLNHINSYLKKRKNLNLPLSQEELALQVFLLDDLLYVKRDHQKALELIDHISPLMHQVEDRSILARFYSSAGAVLSLHRLGSEEGKFLFQKMLDCLNDPSPLDFYEIVRLNNSLGINYLLRSEFNKAKEIISQSLKLIKNFKEPLTKIPTYYYAAWVCIELFEYSQALSFLDQAIELFDKVPDTAIKFYTYNYKARSLVSLGRFKEAQQMCDLAIQGCEKYFGSYQSDTLAEALAYRAESNFHCQKFDQAIDDTNQAIKIYNAFYGGEDKVLDQAYAWIIKGDSYLLKSNLKDAHTSYARAVATFTPLGNSKNSLRSKSTYKKLLFTSSALNKLPLFEFYKATYEETFGEPFEGSFSFYHESIKPYELIYSK